MSLLLGLLVAASFGSGDFLGGLASRRASTLAVLGLAQACALIGGVVVAVVAGGDPGGSDFAFGALAGALNVVALGCLYQGLAIGQIGVVAPVAAVIGAVIPVGWGLATGERPSALAWVGVGLAIVAGALISRERDETATEHAARSLLLAVGAGLGFGLSFIFYASTSDDSGFWPVLAARIASVVIVGVVVMITRTQLTMPRAPAGQAMSAGVLDVAASTLLLVAVRNGLTATVAPVASLAPGFTVAHAHWYLHEKASRTQVVGLMIALVGLALIAAG
jgi:drug/metabolite transporter (DMT)-like permease